MFFFRSSPLLVGLELTSECLKMAALRKEGKRWKIVQLQEFPNDNVKPLDIVSKEALVSYALPSREVLVRTLDMPLKKVKEIEAALPFQIEPHLPYAIDKGVVTYSIIEKMALATRLTVLAAKKDHLQHHLQRLAGFGIDPEVVTAVPSALAHFSHLLPPTEEPLLIIHVGEKEVTVAVVEQGHLLSARSSGIEKSELQKTILALLASYKNKRFDTIYFLGGNEAYATLLQEITGKRVLFPTLSSYGISADNLQNFGLAIGVALAGAYEERGFRTNEFAHKRPWRLISKPLTTYFALGCLVAVALFFTERKVLAEREKHVRSELASLLAREGKPGELPSKKEGIEAVIAKFSAELKGRPDTFPLLPGVPRVKDLLAWLSTHPQAISTDGTPLIAIESCHYTLVRRPELGKKTEPYQVKVDLEFTTPDPNAARAFHEALVAQNPFVNPKHEVQWNPGKGKYRVTFYLKDKTRYS